MGFGIGDCFGSFYFWVWDWSFGADLFVNMVFGWIERNFRFRFFIWIKLGIVVSDGVIKMAWMIRN